MRLTVVIYPDGRTMLTMEDPLTAYAAQALREAWTEFVADGKLAIIPEATVQLVEAEFIDGGIHLRELA